MGRSHASKVALGIFGAVFAGMGLAAYRSCCGRGKRARQAQREATALKKALKNGLSSHRLEDGVFGAPAVVASESALALVPLVSHDGLMSGLAAQKRAAVEIMSTLITIPASLGAFHVFLMDSSIIFSLDPQLKTIVCQLDELDMIREWPVEGDDLIWRGHAIKNVCDVVASRSSNLFGPALAMQAVTLRLCLRNLLQQRQQAREVLVAPSSIVGIIDLQEEEEYVTPSLPAIITMASSSSPTLERSQSDASSAGTSSSSTPMSASGSVVGPFGACPKKVVKKSPLGDIRRQGSAPGKVNGAGRSGLNPNAAAFVPAAAPAGPAPRPYRPRRRRRSGGSGSVAPAVLPPPPPPPPRGPCPTPVAEPCASVAKTVGNIKPFVLKNSANKFTLPGSG